MDRDKIKNWIDEKKEAGEDPEVIVNALLDKGFDDEDLLSYVKDRETSAEELIEQDETFENLQDSVKLRESNKNSFNDYYRPLGAALLVILALSFGFMVTGGDGEFSNLSEAECYSEDLEIVEQELNFVGFQDFAEENDITGETLHVLEEDLDESLDSFEYYQVNFTLEGDFSGEEHLVLELGNNADSRSSTDVFYQSYSDLDDDARLGLGYEVDFRPGYVEVWRAGCRGEVASESF